MLLGARIAVVVPAHDEAPRIRRVIERMPAFVDRIVVVDDASRDETCAIVRACEEPRVRLVRHTNNRGVGASIATGYRTARQDGADVIAVMAGDDQMDPGDLEAVVTPVARHQADYVKGDRIHHAEARVIPFARRVGTTTLGVLTRWAVRAPGLSDSQCGYTAISGDAVDRIDLSSLWPRFGYPNDLLGLIACRRLRIAQVPVRPVYQGEPSELRAWHVATVIALIARAAWRVRRPPR